MIFRGVFFHKRYRGCSVNQFSVPEASLRSKFHSNLDRIIRSSAYARLMNMFCQQGRSKQIQLHQEITHFRPMQLRAPCENGWNTSFRSSTKRSSPSHRSGMNESGCEKLAGLWYIGHCQMVRTVCMIIIIACQLCIHHHQDQTKWQAAAPLTPAGMNWPNITSPPTGTWRGMPDAAGG